MGDLAGESLKEEILHVLRNSDEELRTFRDQIRNKNVIIFIGNTRSGKSTLVNYIIETPLVVFQEGSLFKIEQQNGTTKGPPIGHGTLSHTTVPIVIPMKDEPDTVIVDAPGFDDNRGDVQEIINALYINQIKHSKGVRFVLVSDISNITNDNINYFLSFIETVHTIMPDFEKLKDAVSIIFTKDWRSYDHTEIVKLLRTKILDVSSLRCNKSLIKHFVESENLIGLFRMPSAVGPLTDEINANVDAAIFKSLPISLRETDIKFGISKRARIVLFETYLQFFDLVHYLRELFVCFRTSANQKFSSLVGAKLLEVSSEQLDGESNAKAIVLRLHQRIKFEIENILTAEQIVDSLKRLYIEEVNRAATLIEGIGVHVPEESDPRYNLNMIGEIQRKLEYVDCIEKVIEIYNKSDNILDLYKHNLEVFHKEINQLYEDINNEIKYRGTLTVQIKSTELMHRRLLEADDQYLSASFLYELLSMKQHLKNYISVSDTILQDISRRPSLQQTLTRDIYIMSRVHRDVEAKLRSINSHIQSRKDEALLKDMPVSVGSLAGSLMFFAGLAYFRTLSGATQLKVLGGSLLVFAVFSWKSRYMRKFFLRIHRRYRQKRLVTMSTKFEYCCVELMDPRRYQGQ